MAHSRLALTTMLDWIEQCLTGDAALPTDAEIMERYGFASAEHARTLLAELADAGKITIRGYGADRVILLGRVKSAVVPAPRAAPAVRKVDPEVDRAVVKIRDIITRQAPAAVQIVAANAHALLAAVNPPPAAQTPPLKKEKAMPGPKSIQLPASAPKAIEAIERAGLTPVRTSIRGGTDGSRLSFMGLPCPNIFAGEHAFHSRLEWVSRQDMEKAVQTIVHLAMIWEQRA